MSDESVVQMLTSGRRNGAPGRAPERPERKPGHMDVPLSASPEPHAGRIFRLEHRGEPVASRRVFAARMSMAVLVWLAMALLTLLIGMAGYGGFEGMSLVDAYVNSAMMLSGMGEFDTIKTTGGKIFAGAFALFSGLFMLVATGVVLAPIVHRILHRFHVGSPGKP